MSLQVYMQKLTCQFIHHYLLPQSKQRLKLQTVIFRNQCAFLNNTSRRIFEGLIRRLHGNHIRSDPLIIYILYV